MNVLKIIDDNNLSIRKIPNFTVNMWSHYKDKPIKEGRELISKNIDFSNMNSKQIERLKEIFPDSKRYYEKEIIYPKHGGFYMCQVVDNTSSVVRWSFKSDNLAPTLKESIQKFLDSNKKKVGEK
jgi:hypothetical protein